MAKRTQRFDPRQNMQGETYEVFHYLDIKSRHLDAHYHDFYEVFCFLKGDMDYWIDGSLYHLEPGDILLINPSELHKPVSRSESETYERIVIWIDKKYLAEKEGGLLEGCFKQAQAPYGKILRPSAAEKAHLFETLQKLVAEYYGEEFGNRVCSYGLLLQVLTEICRLSFKETSSDRQKLSTPTLIADVLTYIGEHYGEKLSLDELASYFFVNKYYLAHEFKRAVGTGVHRYITLKRLNRAYELLSRSVPSGQAAQLCGFGDYTTFYRSFKAEYGISPTEVATDQ